MYDIFNLLPDAVRMKAVERNVGSVTARSPLPKWVSWILPNYTSNTPSLQQKQPAFGGPFLLQNHHPTPRADLLILSPSQPIGSSPQIANPTLPPYSTLTTESTIRAKNNNVSQFLFRYSILTSYYCLAGTPKSISAADFGSNAS